MSAFTEGLDVVMGEAYPSRRVESALAIRARSGTSWPVVLFAHGAAPKALEGVLFGWRDHLRPRDAIVFTSRADHDISTRLVDESGIVEQVIPVPVDELFFRSGADRSLVRRRLGLGEDAELIVYAGRINIQKNLHGLLHAFAVVRVSRPKAHLVLAGPDDRVVQSEFGVPNTGYRHYLDRLARSLGISREVIFTGGLERGELAELFAAGDLACSLSFYHRENFGLALAEAQASGLPVVASGWAGHRDVVDPEQGHLVEAVLTEHGIRVDWASAGHAMAALLADRGRHTGSRSSGQWSRRFSLDAVSDQLHALVRTVLDEAPRLGSGPAYRPSTFAEAYEKHKRAHGWYAPEDPQAPWRRPMFQGEDYRLYETMFGAYASRTARMTTPDSLDDSPFPYPSLLAVDESRRLVSVNDPIWPHRRYLDTHSWKVLTTISGTASAGEVIQGDPRRRLTLWRLWVDGIIQLSTGPVPARICAP